MRPSAAIATARSCEPSAGIGTGTSDSSTGVDSRLSSPTTDGSRKDSPALCVRWRTIGLCSSRFQWSERSFHIPKVPNWQIEIVATSSIRRSSLFSTSPARMSRSECTMSMPLSSSFGDSSASMDTLCLSRSHSTRQWFGEATPVVSTSNRNGLRPVPPVILTGSRNSGARASTPVEVRWTSAPSVRYRFDEPVSSNIVRAVRDSSLKRFV